MSQTTIRKRSAIIAILAAALCCTIAVPAIAHADELPDLTAYQAIVDKVNDEYGLNFCIDATNADTSMAVEEFSAKLDAAAAELSANKAANETPVEAIYNPFLRNAYTGVQYFKGGSCWVSAEVVHKPGYWAFVSVYSIDVHDGVQYDGGWVFYHTGYEFWFADGNNMMQVAIYGHEAPASLPWVSSDAVRYVNYTLQQG